MQRIYQQLDLSGAMQSKTSHILRKPNEVESSKNAAYNVKIGSAVRRLGYEKVGRTIEHTKDSLYGGVFTYLNTSKILVGINNADDTYATLRYLTTDDYWSNIISDAAPNTRFNCLSYLDELYIAGATPSGTYMTVRNVNPDLNVSTTRNVSYAPKAKFVTEYGGTIYLGNVQIGDNVYKDRIYFSSNTLSVSFLSRVQGSQSGLLNQLQVDSARYLKVGMVVDVYGSAGSIKVSGLTVVSVDKINDRFSFSATSMNLADNDEIYLSGRKDETNVYWNTDYPNAQEADYLQMSGDITGYTKNNNRLFWFTKNSFAKSDGESLVTVSDTIGCVSHETIQNIGSWTIWLHNTGVWGYNDNTGDLKLLSLAIDDVIKGINQTNLSKASSVVNGRVYKLSVGELISLETDTTSTSTSSTTITTTSTSTSSTSTSSTSASSTSTSATNTTTSTSSTSISSTSSSISSTSSSISTSSTSSSLSTSSTSTSTTVITPRKIIRIIYDFDGNSWWLEEHRREIRFQFMHTMNGYTKPYFTDDTGRLFRDETGQVDNIVDAISMEVTFGRNNFGVDLKKQYLTAIVDSEQARGAIIQYSIDGGPFQTLGEVNRSITLMPFPSRGQSIEGRDINYQIVHNNPGSQAVINGIATYYNLIEALPNEIGVG